MRLGFVGLIGCAGSLLVGCLWDDGFVCLFDIAGVWFGLVVFFWMTCMLAVVVGFGGQFGLWCV